MEEGEEGKDEEGEGEQKVEGARLGGERLVERIEGGKVEMWVEWRQLRPMGGLD